MAPQPIALYRWMLERFAADGPRAREVVRVIGPELAPLVAPGERVLDLCCGGGPWSFFFEEQGAVVTGIDFDPHMIDQARRAAARRGSQVQFVEADVLTHDLGTGHYHLAVLLGNTIADLAHPGFVALVRKVHAALRPGGLFAVQYLDGIAYLDAERSAGEQVEQEEPVRITGRFREYRPEDAAWVVTYVNAATGETYDYTSYLYPAGVLRALVAAHFAVTRSTRIAAVSFLDVFARLDLD